MTWLHRLISRSDVCVMFIIAIVVFTFIIHTMPHWLVPSTATPHPRASSHHLPSVDAGVSKTNRRIRQSVQRRPLSTTSLEVILVNLLSKESSISHHVSVDTSTALNEPHLISNRNRCTSPASRSPRMSDQRLLRKLVVDVREAIPLTRPVLETPTDLS